MMYQNKLVACIKVNGKILRESRDFVSLPFDSEYSIYLKNLNSVRAEVTVTIDGTEAIHKLILNPNSSFELERFVKDLNSGNRFKFIERTREIEDHKGVGGEDGLVRIEYAFEKKKPVVNHETTVHHDYYDYSWGWPYRRIRCWNDGWNTVYTQGSTFCNTGVTRSLGAVQTSSTFSQVGSQNLGQAIGSTQNFQMSESAQSDLNKVIANNLVKCSADLSLNDVGITVPGSVSNQSFITTYGFETEQSDVLVIKLRGYVSEKKVEKAVTVEDKKTCQTCSKINKATGRFCFNCGTALNVI